MRPEAELPDPNDVPAEPERDVEAVVDAVTYADSATAATVSMTVPQASSSAPEKFRWQKDASGRTVQAHVGLNRSQRRTLQKQQELALRKVLKAASKDPKKLKGLVSKLADIING